MQRTTILTGRPVAQLQQDLADAQQAYIDLSTGAKGETYSYTQGNGGGKSVTYTRANLAALVALIGLLQQQLGIVRHARRPSRPLFVNGGSRRW
jgi:hypothetical protein